MTIIRVLHDKEHPAVEVVRTTAQNKALSYEALGMLTYLLSQADDWIVGVDDLIREACGRDKAYRILKELTEAGHLVHVRKGVGQSKPPVWAERTVYELPYTPFTNSVKAGIGEIAPPVPEMPDLANTSENPPIPEKAYLAKSSLIHTSAGAVKPVLKSQSTQEQEQVLKDKSGGGGGDNADARAKIFDQYSALTKKPIESKLVSDQLLDDAAAYPAWWIDEAVTNAALNGVTTWNYVRKMLQAWNHEGRETSRTAAVKGKFPARASPPANGNGKHAESTSVGAPAFSLSKGAKS